MSTDAPKQRLVALAVGEVSLVDHPANEEEFVVTKNLNQPVPTDAEIAKAMLDPYTAQAVTMDAAVRCMYNLADKMRDPSKLGEAQAEIERIKTMLDAAQTLAAQVTKSIDEFETNILVKNADGDKKKMPPWMKERMTKLVESIKTMMDEPAPDATPEQKATKALELLGGIGELIVTAKAGKAQFSKERTSKLMEALSSFAGMMKEADGDAFTAFLSSFAAPAAKQEPAPTTPPAGEAPAWFSSAIEGLTKSVKEAADAAKAAQTSVTEVSKRVEAVEKVEAVSKALPNNGNDNVKKNEPSIWTGIL